MRIAQHSHIQNNQMHHSHHSNNHHARHYGSPIQGGDDSTKTGLIGGVGIMILGIIAILLYCYYPPANYSALLVGGIVFIGIGSLLVISSVLTIILEKNSKVSKL
jgi:hypothetical protein